MSSSTSEGPDREAGRLGGARADFVASLGRKLADARDLLSALQDDLSSKLVRDELRRRLHALGAGARLLKFEGMARALQETLVVLERAAEAGSLRESDVSRVGQALEDLPALAWSEAGRESPSRSSEDAEEGPGHPPITVLVVGGEDLADALMEEGVARPRAFECERSEDVEGGLQLARAYAPDLVIVDADRPGAPGLVEALLDDPLTEPVPVLVVGTFRAAQDAARFVALGVAKSLSKPVAPQTLRGACDEVLDARADRTVRMTLGEPTIEQLAERLAEELKRALIDGLDGAARARRIPLGEGTEVLGALWGTIARVQEIVAQRTGGAIRFGAGAPEGAIALAPWLHQDLTGADRMAGRGRGAGADVRLRGRRVVVADDDPGVTWFISDLLRMAGCEVHEALDGRAALDLAFHVQPELVVSDILMPGLDGFALSRALRRDIALRDTPVILLSWKEDLLQRVRELGASAAAYMRKESDSRAVLARVREVLRPRARIEMRLRGDGEVRGRLDGLSPRLLLELVGAIRRDARIAMRDAMFLYEVDVRGGAPRKITRTASDGSYRSGERAFASLLGVGAGRFVVASTAEPVRGDLAGTLAEQLARPIAAARGALASTTGAATVQVERVVIDVSVLGEYLKATPDPARTVIQRLAAGVSPRQMLLGGEAPPALLEDVLADLSTRDAIRAVEGAGGTDLLGPAVDAALEVIRGAVRSGASLPPNARQSVPVPPAAVRRGPSSAPSASAPPSPSPSAGPAGPPPSANALPPLSAPSEPAESSASAVPDSAADPAFSKVPAPLDAPAAPRYETIRLTDPPDPPAAAESDAAPSSLEDAVMREISDRSPSPGPAHAASTLRSIVEPSELRPRPSDPPDPGEEGARPFPSLPPDAVVPGPLGTDLAAAAEVASELEGTLPLPMPADDLPPAGGAAPGRADPGEHDGAGSERPAGRAGLARGRADPGEHDGAGEGPYRAPFEVSLGEGEAAFPAAAGGASDTGAAPATAPAHEAAGGPEPVDPIGERSRRARGLWILAAALAAGGVAAAARRAVPEGARKPPSAPVASAVAAASLVPPAVSLSSDTSTSGAPAADKNDVPEGAEVPAGYGFLEVHAPSSARVRVDGALVGTGPAAGSPLAPGYHEVVVEQRGRPASKQVVEVRAGKTTRVRVASLP